MIQNGFQNRLEVTMTDDGIGESNTEPIREEPNHAPETDDGSIAEEIEVEPVREPTPEPRRRRGPTPTRGATGDVILQVHIANIFLERGTQSLD